MSGQLSSRKQLRRRRWSSPWFVSGVTLSAVLLLFGTWYLLFGMDGGDDRAPLDAQASPIKVARIEPKHEIALPDPKDLPKPAVQPVSLPMPPTPAYTPAATSAGRQAETGSLVTTYEDDFRDHKQQVAAVDPSMSGRPASQTRAVGFKPLEMQGAEAGVVTDLSHTIKPTTRALCTLDQAIDSQHEGPLVCHLDNDVLAWDNNPVPLLPKGTPVLGSYQTLSVGQGRLMAISANAFRSDGVVVPLGAPFTDDLGRMGIPGHVDTRFWERFGNALIMDAAFAAINLPQAALTSRQPGTTNLNFNFGTTEGVLSQVLSSTVNLPPILRKNQGEQVMLLITQPIHVSPVRYEVSP